MGQKIIPHLWFDNQAEQAVNLYTRAFTEAKIISTSRYSSEASKVAHREQGSVMTVEFSLFNQRFVALNGGPLFSFTPAISFFVQCDTVEEVDRLYGALSNEGSSLMPLDTYPFSERYAWFTDKYGVSWQLFYGKAPQKISPCLMFIQKNYGKAHEAIEYYTSLFDDSKIELLVPYEENEGEQKGALKHASFYLSNYRFVALESGREHSFNFTPAISFLVLCHDQQEIDHLWNSLSAVPQAEQCGWLQDKFGISWQIVPESLQSLLSVKDTQKAEHVMSTMFSMKKLDIEALRKAAL